MTGQMALGSDWRAPDALIAELARGARARWPAGAIRHAPGMGVMSFRRSHVVWVAEATEGAVAGLWRAPDTGRIRAGYGSDAGRMRAGCGPDAGRIMHRDTVLAPVEGARVRGWSTARVERLDVAERAARAEIIVDCPVIRPDAAAPVDVGLVAPDAEALPCGIGESGAPVVIPAIGYSLERAAGRAFDRLAHVV